MRHHTTFVCRADVQSAPTSVAFDNSFSASCHPASFANRCFSRWMLWIVAMVVTITCCGVAAAKDPLSAVKFRPLPATSPYATVPAANSSLSGLPRLPLARDFDTDTVHNGLGFHLVVLEGVPTVGPLDGEPGPFTGTDLNSFLGADRFYLNGIAGQNVVAANVEGGLAWDGHETLTHANAIPNALQPQELDRHATWTSAIQAGQPVGPGNIDHQLGIAPGAEFHTGGVATDWGGSAYSFSFSVFSNVLFDTYNNAMLVGLNGPSGMNNADVINNSYAVLGSPTPGNFAGDLELMLDAMVFTNQETVMTYGAGNSGTGSNTVLSPATSYNGITVAALSPVNNYDSPSVFSSGGTLDYHDPVNGTAPDVRSPVDIAAPGEDIGSAYYGGQTGGTHASSKPY